MPASPLIPAQQWAQVIEKTGGPVNYKQISVQKPKSDEVLVHVRYSGVCHTDLHAMLGDWPLKEKRPLVGGHEGAGVVVAIGDQVTSLGVGDHVGIKWINGACHDCTFCHRGEEQLCAQALLSGYTVDGTFQQYTVAKAAYVARIPEECNLEDVAPVLCAGLTVYRGLKESGARPGEYVAVVGAGGGLGCFALQYAHAMGLRCIAVDSGDEKAEVCKSLGAEAFIDYEKTRHLGADIKAATHSHLGPHAVLLLATHEEPFQQASKYVRPGGCIVCIGMPGHSFLKASVFDTVVRVVTIKGSYVGNRQDMSEALEFFRRGLIKAPHKLIGLSRLGEVYDLMLKDSVVGRYVLDTSC